MNKVSQLKSPFVRESIFADSDAANVNADVLREIFTLFDSNTYNKDNDSFSSKYPSWGVSIRDIHDDEDEPHYLLTVGLGPFERNPSSIFTVRYCDYKSIPPKGESKGVIRENTGKYTIQIWLPESCTEYDYTFIGKELNLEYCASVRAFLMDYTMLASPFAPPEVVPAPEGE